MFMWTILGIIVVVALALTLGVDWLLARFGIRRVDPEESRTGFHQVTDRIQTWVDRRR